MKHVKLRVLVVDALARAEGKRYSTFDVVGAGPRIVAGILEELGHHVSLKTYEYVMENIRDLLHYDAVLISAMSQDRIAVYKLINRLRVRGYKGLIIIGGPISFDYAEILNNIRGLDYVVIGEAEVTLYRVFSEKIDAFTSKSYEDLLDVPALAYRLNNKIIITSSHIHVPKQVLSKTKPWIRVNESYPSHKVYRYYVEVVRGCSNFHRPLISGYPGLNCIRCMICYNKDLKLRLKCPMNIPPGCGFCSVPYQFGPPRSKSIKSIINEVEGLITHGARRIVLSAPDFLDYMREEFVEPDPLTDPCYPEPNIDAIEDLLNNLYSIPEVSSGKTVIMIENIKACLVNDDVAKILGKYLKGTTIHIGMETGDAEFNKYIGKPITPEQVYKAIKLLREAGLRPYIYLIYGLPFMNRETYMKTIESINVLSRLGVEKITLYKFTPLPYTAFSKLRPEIKKYIREIKLLKQLVNKYNLESKKKLLGKRIEVYLLYSHGKYYGYPVHHGPTVFVKGLKSEKFSGCRALVEVIDVAPRYVWGKFIRIAEC